VLLAPRGLPVGQLHPLKRKQTRSPSTERASRARRDRDVLEARAPWGAASGDDIPAPSWTWQGHDLFGEPNADFSVPGPLIKVTDYTGPVYVIQGEQDEIWDVSRGKHLVAERKAVRGLVTQSHFFPGEGCLPRPGRHRHPDRRGR
jgi:hypothetical protein